MKSGFVAVIGRPNAGKSTLINSLVGQKVAITSSTVQTTRNVIQGIYNDDDTQIVFVDTPGIHKPINKLGNYLNKQAYYSIHDVDAILLIVDVDAGLGKGDMFIIDKLTNVKTPVILVLNKIDKIRHNKILEKIMEYKDMYDFSEIVPLSALKKNNVDELIKTIKPYLNDEIMYYPKEDYTNRSLSFMIGEIVREKAFAVTHEEVPHSLTCIVSKMVKDKDKYIINVDIIVDRDSLKKIVIGKQGDKIKRIGMEARRELEEFLGCKVYLETFVKTIKNWRDKENQLQELGFKEAETGE